MQIHTATQCRHARHAAGDYEGPAGARIHDSGEGHAHAQRLELPPARGIEQPHAAANSSPSYRPGRIVAAHHQHAARPLIGQHLRREGRKAERRQHGISARPQHVECHAYRCHHQRCQRRQANSPSSHCAPAAASPHPRTAYTGRAHLDTPEGVRARMMPKLGRPGRVVGTPRPYLHRHAHLGAHHPWRRVPDAPTRYGSHLISRRG